MFDNNSIKSAHFHIPVYDTDVFPEYRKDIVDVITKNVPSSDFIKACKDSFNDRCKELEKYLNENKDWDLVMMYWFVLDAIQHAFFKNKLKIMDFYMMFNEYVGKLKSKLPEDTLLLIISDHGQEKGIHTDHGFYSSNKKLNLKNPKITDFKQIIEKISSDE
jgi:predicted AlkP superfamily pyrophosphatase or phosphodiesterase